jgi:DNA-binding IclR family transcriptional regulator
VTQPVARQPDPQGDSSTTHASEVLDHALQALLRDHVNSFEKLEAVLLVRERGAPVSLSELADTLRLTHSDARRTVAALCASGLLVQHPDAHVAEAVDALVRARVDALAHAYKRDGLAVVSSISRHALVRLRHSAAFANRAERRSRARLRIG